MPTCAFFSPTTGALHGDPAIEPGPSTDPAECTHVVFTAEEYENGIGGGSLLPELSSQDGALIGMAIFGAWIVAWTFREIGRVLADGSKSTED